MIDKNNLPDQLSLLQVACLLCSKDMNAKLDSEIEKMISHLFTAVDEGYLAVYYEDSLILGPQPDDEPYLRGLNTELIKINQSDFLLYCEKAEDTLNKNYIGTGKTAFLNQSPLGIPKGKYDKCQFWGDFYTGVGNDNIFAHSKDFRTINLLGEQIVLTAQQAEVIEILYDAYKNKTPTIGQAYILEAVDSNASNRLRDIFKSSPEAWKKLIREGEKKGTYRLNI